MHSMAWSHPEVLSPSYQASCGIMQEAILIIDIPSYSGISDWRCWSKKNQKQLEELDSIYRRKWTVLQNKTLHTLSSCMLSDIPQQAAIDDLTQ